MRWVQRAIDEKQFAELRKEKLHPIFATLLSNRNFSVVRNKRDIQGLLESGLSQLEDPANITGMSEVAEVLSDVRNKTAIIFGDYDVDGVVSSYMLRRLLYEAGAKTVNVFLPTRSIDGYGLNNNSVKRFLSLLKIQYDFVIALDCGVSSYFQIEEIRKAQSQAKICVIDHHIPDYRYISRNADALCNFHLGSGNPYCTTGLIYQLSRIMSRRMLIDTGKLLPYAALGTIADVCELTNSNRVIVKNGLNELVNCYDQGMMALLKEARVNAGDCDEEDVAFKIAPMINASGRLKLASYVFKLLITNDPEEAQALAKELVSLNEKRKRIQANMFKQAVEIVDPQMGGRSSIIAYHEEWDPGIVGIVASKLMERYNVPVICLGQSDGKIKGSARSMNEINVKEILDSCSQLFYKHGGHKKAAGVTMNPERMDDAWEVFDTAVQEYCKTNDIQEPATLYDIELDRKMIDRMSQDMCERISRLGPFGQSNPKPVFLMKNAICTEVRPWKSGKGGFVTFDHLNMTVFGFGEDVDTLFGRELDILLSTTKSFLDEERWALRIVDSRDAQ